MNYEEKQIIRKFCEDNWSWLSSFKYNDLEEYYQENSSFYPGFWNSDKGFGADCDFYFYLEPQRNNNIWSIYIWRNGIDNKDLIELSMLSGYFSDWERPKQEERDYFEMITGHKIPWSEDKPLVLN